MTTLKQDSFFGVSFPLSSVMLYFNGRGREHRFFYRIYLPLSKVNAIFPLGFKTIWNEHTAASLNKECGHTSKCSGYCKDQHFILNQFVQQKSHTDSTGLLSLLIPSPSIKLPDKCFVPKIYFFWKMHFFKTPVIIPGQCYTGVGDLPWQVSQIY